MTRKKAILKKNVHFVLSIQFQSKCFKLATKLIVVANFLSEHLWKESSIFLCMSIKLTKFLSVWDINGK